MAVPVLEMFGISKGFPRAQALDEVAIRLFPGEIHALMGENGAGKSTLVKVLTGIYEADSGLVAMDDIGTDIRDPLHAQELGIRTVYQEFNLCPNLSVAENIFIGRQPRRFGRIDWTAMRRRAAELLSELDLDIDVTAQLGSYSLAVQQLVAIARAVDLQARVLILDEPTSSLDQDEVKALFTVMRRLRREGVAILFVSHSLEQIFEICERVTILRNGRLMGEYPMNDLNQFDSVPLTSSGRVYQAQVFDTGPLASGVHTVKARSTNNAYFIVDAFQISRPTSLNDTNGGISYTGSSWYHSGNRNFGDYENDVHSTRTDGESFSQTFTGTGVDLISEKFQDQGLVDVFIDGTLRASNPTRLAQQVIYSVRDLPSGQHTIRAVKRSGSCMLLDRIDTFTS